MGVGLVALIVVVWIINTYAVDALADRAVATGVHQILNAVFAVCMALAVCFL